MELITQFVKTNKEQLVNIYKKDSEGNNDCIIVINYTKIEDVKVACLEISTLNEEICKQLTLIKKKTKDYNNANYSIAINDKKVDILKYNDENEDNVIDVIEENEENQENQENQENKSELTE